MTKVTFRDVDDTIPPVNNLDPNTGRAREMFNDSIVGKENSIGVDDTDDLAYDKNRYLIGRNNKPLPAKEFQSLMEVISAVYWNLCMREEFNEMTKSTEKNKINDHEVIAPNIPHT